MRIRKKDQSTAHEGAARSDPAAMPDGPGADSPAAGRVTDSQAGGRGDVGARKQGVAAPGIISRAAWKGALRFVPLAAGMGFLVLGMMDFTPSPEPAPVRAATRPAPEPAARPGELTGTVTLDALATPRIERPIRVGRGDTLIGLLMGAGVPRGQAHGAIAALAKHYNPRRLKSDHALSVVFERARDGEAPRFAGLSLKPEAETEISVRHAGGGRFSAETVKKALMDRPARASGEIQSSLYEAARARDVPLSVLMELIRIYSWDVDFQREIRPGDRFEVMHQRLHTLDGTFARNGDILFARLTLEGSPRPLYRFETADGLTDYFDAKGRSARKALLRTPLNGARLTSRFGRRRHPILGYTRMHRGVDFAAPRGTPVYAAGDGRVVYRGRKGAYGNYVSIRHNSTYVTAYAHLRRFARAARKGKRVVQGQIIGYVGSTGRSTGPHLHYEILKKRRQVNPMRLRMPSGRRLKGAELRRFEARKAALDQRFAALGEPRTAARDEN